MYFGWGMEQPLSNKLHIYSGLRLGHYLMYFDDDNININLKSESEFSAGIGTGIKISIKNNYFLDMSGRYQIIYTYHRIHYFFISIGLGKTFVTPGWLEDFLS